MHKIYPEFNIWEENVLNSKLYANEKDYCKEKSSELKNLFFKEQVLGNSTVLMEKLPINNFRLKFLQKCFPKASKYIYLTRNGLEVSKSIEKEYRKTIGTLEINLDCYNSILKAKTNIMSDQQKGMWEWKLSMDQSDLFFQKLNRDKFIHLSYQDFIENTEYFLRKNF